MPRGKYLRKNKRNESALITRLMQISLRMDDHIHYGKHITVSQAGGFLQEITALKLQCLPTNVRALQVIEKLTRCMRSILTGEDNVHGICSFNKSVTNTEYAGSTSPVYSLPDEDRIIDTDEQNEVNILNSPDKDETVNKHIIFLDKSKGQDNVVNDYKKQDNIISNVPFQVQNESHCAKNSLNDIEVIDLTENDNTDEAENIDPISNIPNSIVHINSGISKMSIQDGLVSQTNADDNIYSQSILDNYDNDKGNKLADTEKDDVGEKEMYHKVNAKAHVMTNVNNYFNAHTPLTPIYTQSSNNATSKLVSSQPNKVDTELLTKSKPPLVEKKIKRKRMTNTGKGKSYNGSANKNSKKNSNNLPQYCSDHNTMTTKYVDKTIGNSSKKIKKPRKNVKKKVHEIYNNNVENDLSWVENLRYVREISADEHDPSLSLLQDKFWDNFALPDTWNDSEFD